MIGQPGFAAGEMRPNGSKGRGGSAGPHLSGAKMGERARCPRRGQRPASVVSRSEMEPNGDKRRDVEKGRGAVTEQSESGAG